VVADARQNFASSNVSLLPPLPVPPGPQTRRSSRDRSQWPSRRALPASQVFQVEEDSSVDQSFASSSNSAQNDHHNVVLTHILPTGPREGPSCSAFSYDGPRPTRRATVLGRTPEKPRILTIDTDMTPSKRREKSKSANDLNRLIRPVSKVQFELDKRESKHVDNRLSVTYLSVLVAAKSNLSAVLDRDLFTPDPVPIDPDSSGSWNDDATAHSPGRNSLTDSPFVVHPYPSRKQAVTPAMDSPTRRDLEGVYDRLLMATSGVKRVGKGYQSSHVKPISTNISPSSSKSPGRFFHSTRRPMPPPVSSEDKFMTWTSDELGIMSSDYVNVGGPGLCEDHAGTAKAVSRALKALVTGKAVVKKASRTS
jgi:serine/threonine-protein kinase GIN4